MSAPTKKEVWRIGYPSGRYGRLVGWCDPKPTDTCVTVYTDPGIDAPWEDVKWIADGRPEAMTLLVKAHVEVLHTQRQVADGA